MERGLIPSELSEKRLAELYEEHIGLVHAIVARFLGRGVEREDLLQIASIGLVRAIRGFDESRGYRFSTYAVPVIDGEIRTYLRENSAVKISRSIRQNAARLFASAERLGGEATLEECASEAGLSPEEAALAAGALSPPASLDDPNGREDVLSQETGYEAVLDRVALQEGMSRLSREDAAIISLRYFRSLTQEQTARVLKKSQVQISRAEKRILEKLREILA